MAVPMQVEDTVLACFSIEATYTLSSLFILKACHVSACRHFRNRTLVAFLLHFINCFKTSQIAILTLIRGG